VSQCSQLTELGRIEFCTKQLNFLHAVNVVAMHMMTSSPITGTVDLDDARDLWGGQFCNLHLNHRFLERENVALVLPCLLDTVPVFLRFG